MCKSSDPVVIGTLSVSDRAVNDPAINDHESECLICGHLTDHASGVCCGCSQEDIDDVFDGDYDHAYDRMIEQEWREAA